MDEHMIGTNIMMTSDGERGIHSENSIQDNFIRNMNMMSNEDSVMNPSAEKNVRSRRIDYKEKDSSFHAARFLFECGYKLKCCPETIAAAASLFHRFFKECEASSYDKYLIASTTLYIVGKLYDEKFRIRDVINVSHNTLNRGAPMLELGEDYWLRRDAIVQAELLIMRMLSFNVTYNPPHKYLLHYLMTLKTWMPQTIWDTVPIIPASYGFLQDLHHDSAVVQYSPQHIAIACISLALLCYGVEVPEFAESDAKKWYNAMVPDLTEDKLTIIIDSVMDVYSLDTLHGSE